MSSLSPLNMGMTLSLNIAKLPVPGNEYCSKLEKQWKFWVIKTLNISYFLEFPWIFEFKVISKLHRTFCNPALKKELVVYSEPYQTSIMEHFVQGLV